MRIPRGELCWSRVVDNAAVVLRMVLDEEFTGYAAFEPQDALLLSKTTRGVITFEDGVPTLAYDAECEVDGRDGLEGFVVTGLIRAAAHVVDAAELTDAHEVEALRVPPGEPAHVLVGDERLTARTLDAAPAAHREESRSQSAVEAFPADADAIEEIRSEAREEVRVRASERGLDDVLANGIDELAAIDAGPGSR